MYMRANQRIVNSIRKDMKTLVDINLNSLRQEFFR